MQVNYIIFNIKILQPIMNVDAIENLILNKYNFLNILIYVVYVVY